MASLSSHRDGQSLVRHEDENSFTSQKVEDSLAILWDKGGLTSLRDKGGLANNKDSFTCHEDENENSLSSQTVREQRMEINMRLEELDLTEDKMSVTGAEAEELDGTDDTTEADAACESLAMDSPKSNPTMENSLSRHRSINRLERTSKSQRDFTKLGHFNRK